MKFHKLEIENITSLYGKHVVDFEGVFGDAGLYLITGATGGGKTTLLDAICLTLFAKTPRLSGATKAVADSIMSRGTGQASVRLHFSVLGSDGLRCRYEAAWSANRAREKPDGKIQDIRRELVAIGSDGTRTALCNSTKAKDARLAFESVFGDLSFDVFLRSVMLPQGEFARLLKADAATKASILNRVADTERYLKIGEAAEERKKQEQQKSEHLEARLEGYAGATPTAITQAEDTLADTAAIRDKLAGYDTTADEWIAWLSMETRLAAEQSSALQESGEALADREDHSADFALRDADRSVLPARKPLEDADRERRQAAEKTIALETAHDSLKVLRTDQVDVAKSLAAARTLHASATAALDAIADELKHAREAKGSRDAAKKAAIDADVRRGVRQVAAQAADTKAKLATQSASLAETGSVAAETALSDVATDAALRDVLVGCEALAKQVDQRDEEASARRLDVAAATANVSRLEAEAIELAATTSSVDDAKATLEGTQVALASLLGDFSTAALWQEAAFEQDRARDQTKRDVLAACVALAGATDARKARRTHTDKHDATAAAHTASKAQHEAARAAHEAASITLEHARSAVADLQTRVLAQTLRSALCEGSACPVCGGEDHPAVSTYGDSSSSEAEAAATEQKTERDRELRAAEQAHDGTRQALQTSEIAVVRAEESVKAAKEAFDDFEPRYTDAVSALDAALTACGREFEAHERQPKIITQWLEEQVEAAEKESLSALERANEVKTADERHEAARVAASQAQTADEERSKRRQLLDGQIDVAKAEAASAELQLGRERDGAQKLEDQFAAQLDTAAIPSPRREGRLDSVSALRTLRERVAEFDRRKQCAEEAKIAANAAHTALAAAQGAHEHAVRELEEATLQLEEAEKDTGRHNAKLNTLFDGQDPDDVEIQHKAAIAAAVLNHEDAQRAATESENAVIRAQTTAQGLDKQVKEHKTQAIAADVLLQTALSNIEAVETLDDIRAKLLSDEERTRVGELCTALERREEAADVELKRVAAHAASHLDKRPDGLVAGDVDLEHVQTVRAQIAAALESWNEEVGSHRQRVKQLHADARDAAELLSEAEAQRNVASTWQRLHDLIGLNKGANFQRFALALALERLLLRANHRLQTLHPRYQLAPTPDETGLPTLDFDVVDLYQAGVTRPVATLSGGESFLASLALALAVVDEQQLSLPIETLLLDEGFGTLDEQSLSQAMTTLERLQLQDSRTVGLISHVESLKTRVTNQVQILPAGQDRSTVKLRVWGTPS